MNTLNKALTANFITSLCTGLILLIFQKAVANIFGVQPHPVFPVIGAGLLLFALTIALEIKKQRSLAILWISIQDLMWVAGSTTILIIQPFDISTTGYWIIDIVAMLVLIYAIFQLIGLGRMDTRNGAKVMSFRRVVKADKKMVWNIVTDLGNYHKVAPNIDDVKIISGEGKGMIRSCSHGKDSWEETCTLWVEEKMYAFEVDTTAPDYPFPFSYLKGTWEVNPINKTETEILMEFEAVYKKKIYNSLMHPLAKIKFGKVGEELLDNWQKMAEKK